MRWASVPQLSNHPSRPCVLLTVPCCSRQELLLEHHVCATPAVTKASQLHFWANMPKVPFCLLILSLVLSTIF